MPRHALLLAGLLPWAAQAQSRIDEVLVYPGGAQVTRLAPVAAGARELVLPCLTAQFDSDSLRVEAPAGVVLGPVQVETLPRARAPECANSALDERVRQLESQRDTLTAESTALDTSLGYLKALGSGEARGTPAAGIAGTADTIRKAALDALQRQAQLKRQLQELDKQITPLRVERDQRVQANPQWRTVRVRLSASREAELKVSYRLNQAGWEPGYRALLDTASATLTLERLAEVSQQSGEDWKNVRLRLSTVAVDGQPGPRELQPWTLAIRPPMPAPAPSPKARAASMLESVTVTGTRIDPDAPPTDSFDLSVFEGAYATEFALPGRISIDSGTARASLALSAEKLPVRLLARVQPQGAVAAYLVADLAKPAGSWPTGTVQLLRDGAFVGTSELRIADGEPRLELPFGRDDAVRVQREPEQRNAANTGFIGPRAESRVARAYVVKNEHTTPVTLQVIEVAPVSQHEDIKVQAQFTPTPATQAWRKQPGFVLWELPLAAGASQRFTAEYLISALKEAVVTGLR